MCDMNEFNELKEMQRIAHVGSWYWDAETDENQVSEEMCRIFGREAVPPFAQQSGTIFLSEIWQQLNTAVQETVRTGTGYNLELPALREDGTPIWINTRGEAVRDANGKVVGLRGTVQDITERKQAGFLLRDSMLMNKALFEKAAYAVALAKLPDGIFVEVNEEWIRLFGYSKDEAIGKTSLESGCKPNSVVREHIVAELKKEGHVRNVEVILIPKNGVALTMLADINLFTVGGQEYLLSITQDITEKKRAETKLSESEQMLDFAMKLAHMGSWNINLLDKTAHRTLEHDRIFGYESLLPEWNYDMFLDHVLESDRDEVDRHFNEAIASETDWNFECCIRRNDGEVRWILVAGSPQRDDQGKVNSMTGIVQDITRHKRLEQAMQDKNVELERSMIAAEKANLAKSHFLSSMSHELRTPLNAILGFARLMEAGIPPPTETQSKRLQQIIKGGWYLLELINEILDLSLIESGNLSLTGESVSLAEVMLECRDMIEPLAKKAASG
jgi:PAS domain S-box-containing protein